jgi:hypothetical protein
MFRGKAIRPGFSRREELIGKRAASGDGPAGLTPWWRRPGVGRATLGCAWSCMSASDDENVHNCVASYVYAATISQMYDCNSQRLPFRIFIMITTPLGFTKNLTP